MELCRREISIYEDICQGHVVWFITYYWGNNVFNMTVRLENYLKKAQHAYQIMLHNI
jgi:hypothetical protein